jgi:hypothetical protein
MEFDEHISQDALEQYAMETLPESERRSPSSSAARSPISR